MQKRLVAISFPYRDLLDNPTGRTGATRIEWRECFRLSLKAKVARAADPFFPFYSAAAGARGAVGRVERVEWKPKWGVGWKQEESEAEDLRVVSADPRDNSGAEAMLAAPRSKFDAGSGIAGVGSSGEPSRSFFSSAQPSLAPESLAEQAQVALSIYFRTPVSVTRYPADTLDPTPACSIAPLGRTPETDS